MRRPPPDPGLAGAGIVVLLAMAVAAGEASAQEQTAPPQEEAATELVFQREVFTYPQFERRNPFAALVGAGDGGPRFEELALLGVIYSPEPPLSVALLATGVQFGPGGGVSGQDIQTYRVREGETLGNSRILEIQRDRVIVEVTEFGMTEQRVLELRRPTEGGSS